MIGERVFPDKFGQLRLPEGGYGRDLRHRWWIRPVGGNSQQVASPSVIEHSDGTISVTDGINGSARSIIQRGVWEES